jgi:hypothetical protein
MPNRTIAGYETLLFYFLGGVQMLVRMKITLDQEIYAELVELALAELRTPESQLLYILLKELNLHNQSIEEDDPSRVNENSVFKEVSNGK